MKAMITLHHFTVPQWFEAKGALKEGKCKIICKLLVSQK
jgi:beta-glucosidase/6-phospho-beta-glucosidase/beta-galactosidase